MRDEEHGMRTLIEEVKTTVFPRPQDEDELCEIFVDQVITGAKNCFDQAQKEVKSLI